MDRGKLTLSERVTRYLPYPPPCPSAASFLGKSLDIVEHALFVEVSFCLAVHMIAAAMTALLVLAMLNNLAVA
jgi:hypothetical protein